MNAETRAKMAAHAAGNKMGYDAKRAEAARALDAVKAAAPVPAVPAVPAENPELSDGFLKKMELGIKLGDAVDKGLDKDFINSVPEILDAINDGDFVKAEAMMEKPAAVAAPVVVPDPDNGITLPPFRKDFDGSTVVNKLITDLAKELEYYKALANHWEMEFIKHRQ